MFDHYQPTTIAVFGAKGNVITIAPDLFVALKHGGVQFVKQAEDRKRLRAHAPTDSFDFGTSRHFKVQRSDGVEQLDVFAQARVHPLDKSQVALALCYDPHRTGMSALSGQPYIAPFGAWYYDSVPSPGESAESRATNTSAALAVELATGFPVDPPPPPFGLDSLIYGMCGGGQSREVRKAAARALARRLYTAGAP